ncbi:MAG: nucleoside hydrolase [Oscillospiraceae bacterium]|jgi:purine nucleosidase
MDKKHKLIVDTDCGSDDAMAIAMALNDPNWEIMFFSTVCGNVNARQAAVNTLTTLEKTGSYEPPVYIGAEKPLLKEPVYAHETHGEDGMGDIGLVPERLRVSEGNGILKTLEAIRDGGDREIEIIALGPLTNIALEMRIAPEVMKKVKRISIMGSAGLGTGNVTPVAEFNIWQDAEAAKIVLDFGVPLMFVGWDACLDEAMLDPDDIEEIRNSGPLGRFAIDCNKVLMDMNVGRFGYPCLDMADPAAMAAAIHPECIDVCDEYYCEMDVTEGPGYGNLIVDKYRFSVKQPNAAICSRLKPAEYKNYIKAMLKS